MSVINNLRKQLSIYESVDDKVKHKLSKIRQIFDYEIMYLPTYHRIEEALVSLGLSMGSNPHSSSRFKTSTINFGMNELDMFPRT